MLRRSLQTAVGLAGAIALFAASEAAAHAHFLSSTPAPDATVAAPDSITVNFSGKLVPAFSTFELAMPERGVQVPVKTSVSEDGKSIIGKPKSKLGKGRYTLTWHAASVDGHRGHGELKFEVK